jgi:hypothetical protein
MRLSSNKDVNDLIKEAQRQGWTITMTRSNHLKWVSPMGDFFFSSSTPSDGRRVVNKISQDLRMNGFIQIKHKQSRKKR